MPNGLKKGWRDECGVFGVFLRNSAISNEAARDTYYGMYALQHRGQESAGIAVSDGREINLYKGMGLVSEVFTPELVQGLMGNIAVGHVRYSTTGSSHVINAQPLVFRYLRGMVALAHNGNLVNAVQLRNQLATFGSVFQSTSDTEIIVNLIARYGQDRLEDALVKCMLDIKGAYSLVVMTEDKLIGMRDPMAIRPLCLGASGDNHFLASESCALDTVGAKFVRDIRPGEVVVIDKDGVNSINTLATERTAHCIFEYIYLARPDSVIDGINVNRYRRLIGKQLARETNLDADIVIAVPDSGTSAALGYAEESGIRYEEGLIKNRYIGRTFIQPTQKMRDLGVRLKLNPVVEAVNGKRVIMVDDSIVRGTTSKQIVNMLREAGAAKVHMAVASPPTIQSCYYGIDTSHRDELIAAQMDVEGVRKFIGADSLHYLSMEGLYKSMKGDAASFCAACFDGSYPIPIEESAYMNHEKLQHLRGGC
ncbi:MAG: amidophosphoribosyltransferase [Syntrophomonadaceae bacterium]|nr:amidophosphoribosyltransferase [Syntrophomonadaceae bacterium]